MVILLIVKQNLYWTHIQALQSLHWYLFFPNSNTSPKSYHLTMSALRFSINRSHLVCNIWIKSNQPSPPYLKPEDYGWNNDTANKPYEAIMTNQLPAPKQIVELCVCKRQSGFNMLRCSCRKNNLVCTEMCICSDCSNYMKNKLDSESDEEDC